MNKNIYLFGSINDDLANNIIKELIETNKNEYKNINLYINSGGGSIVNAFAICSVINNIEIKEENIFARNYQRNKTLIDFDYIPSEIKESIKKAFKETKAQKANPIEIMKFCSEHKLKQLMGNYSVFLLNKQEDIGDW